MGFRFGTSGDLTKPQKGSVCHFCAGSFGPDVWIFELQEATIMTYQSRDGKFLPHFT